MAPPSSAKKASPADPRGGRVGSRLDREAHTKPIAFKLSTRPGYTFASYVGSPLGSPQDPARFSGQARVPTRTWPFYLSGRLIA